MEVLYIIRFIGLSVLWLLLWAVAIFIGAILAFIILAYVLNFLPAISGISLGVYLWRSGHDNIAVIISIIGIAINCLWRPKWMTALADIISEFNSGPTYDAMGDKKRRYDNDGNVIGFEDKD